MLLRYGDIQNPARKDRPKSKSKEEVSTYYAYYSTTYSSSLQWRYDRNFHARPCPSPHRRQRMFGAMLNG
jgi:hypothetical protein